VLACLACPLDLLINIPEVIDHGTVLEDLLQWFLPYISDSDINACAGLNISL